MHFNPDHYLQTDSGRLYTAERNIVAWDQLCADLSAELHTNPRRIVMVLGVQGAGKSTWVRQQISDSNDAIYVDSTFATSECRSRIIDIAKIARIPISAVWLKVGLEAALRRNRVRPADEVVPDDAIENVFNIFEPPVLSEGFTEVLVLEVGL